MLTLPHTLLAALIVKYFPNPWLALFLALLSHFFLDFYIIHWNPHLYSEYKQFGKIKKSSLTIIFIDTLLAFVFCFFLVLKYWSSPEMILLFAAAIFLATLPDTIEIPYYFFHNKTRWLKRYIDFQHLHQSNGSFIWGVITQAVLIGICLFFFLR